MKLLALALALVSSSAFASSQSIDVAAAHTGFKMDQAVYSLIPTKTEIREIPGCNPNGENSGPCWEEVVLESKPMVQVFVDYTEGVFRDPEAAQSYLTFNFEVSEFNADAVASLKNASPMWRLGGGSVRKAFARNNFSLNTKLAARTIQVVDVRNSTICQVMESGDIVPGCVENIVYKPAQTTVREVTVSTK
jgi:hypothetical protein